MTIYLGLDYGTSSIGYAIGQTITGTAQPKGALKVKQGEIDWQALNKIIKEWQITEIVMGYPLNMDGTTQKLSAKVYKFAQQLRQALGLAVILVDERLTSVAARDFIYTNKSSKALKKELVDATSAAFILQSYLDGEPAIEIL